jgi:glycosyltransferase involved in cell wall biosynthesis
MARIVVIGSLARSLITFRGRLMQDFIASGHKVMACAPGASEQVQRDLKAMGVEYCDIPLRRRGLNPFHDLAYMLRLVGLFKSWKADIILGYTAKPSIYGSIAARLAGLPYAVMITGLGQSFGGGSFKKRCVDGVLQVLYRVALRNSRVVFFQNPDDLARFRAMNLLARGSRVSVIPGSGIDLEEFLPSPYPAQVTFLLMARVIPEKGIYQYVRAATLLREKYPAVRFRLAGPIGTSKAFIPLSEVEGWHRAGIIEYLGMLEDVKPALSDCSVYVLPSYYGEGVPRSILEAMACGRAIITTDATGCRETVSDQKNGFLVPVRDAMALATAMEKFIQNPDLIVQMGALSRELAEIKFDVLRVNRLIFRGIGLFAYPWDSLTGESEKTEGACQWRDS